MIRMAEQSGKMKEPVLPNCDASVTTSIVYFSLLQRSVPTQIVVLEESPTNGLLVHDRLSPPTIFNIHQYVCVIS